MVLKFLFINSLITEKPSFSLFQKTLIILLAFDKLSYRCRYELLLILLTTEVQSIVWITNILCYDLRILVLIFYQIYLIGWKISGLFITFRLQEASLANSLILSALELETMFELRFWTSFSIKIMLGLKQSYFTA